jgi:hypothetical protein
MVLLPLQIGMDPTLVKGKKGSASSGDDEHLFRTSAHQKHPTAYMEPLKSGIKGGNTPPPPIPPLAPLGAADSATWLRFKADLLKYQGLQMQYQANLLEKQARALLRQGGDESNKFAAHASQLVERGDEQSNSSYSYYSCQPENCPQPAAGSSDGINSNIAVIQGFSRRVSVLGSHQQQEDQQLFAQPRRVVPSTSVGSSRADYCRSLGSASPRDVSSSVTPPSEDMDDEEEEDGPMDLSSSRGDADDSCSGVMTHHYDEPLLPEQQGSHLRYSTLPRIFFRQQEVGGGGGGAYSD